MPHQRVTPFLRSAARSMRRHPVNAEQALWWRLRKNQLGGFRFRRQHPIGRFIGDFVCLEVRLIVEVDGIQHRNNAEDVRRTEVLFNLGFNVVRFENDRVRAYIDDVCDEILAIARSRLSGLTEEQRAAVRHGSRRATPHPPPSGAPSPTRGEG